MFRRFKAAAHAFVAASNAPAVPVEGGEDGDAGNYNLSDRLPPNWKAMFGGDGAGTASAERLAAVYGCVQVIAASIAAMPLQLYRKKGESRERETTHPLAKLLAGRPNGVMTWPEMREALLFRQILRGDSYARGFWSGGDIREIFPIPGECVTPKLTDLRQIKYDIGSNPNKIPTGTFGLPDILHFKALTSDGIQGINPIKHCRMSTASAAALASYGRDAAESGQPIRGIITSQSTFGNDKKASEVRRRWGEAWNQAKDGDGIAIFEGGDMKYHPITMSMRDAQFIESMAFSVEEICRIFNVPPHKVQKLDRATFNNIEHLSREFYMATLVPWITRIEATLNFCLLTEGDRAAGLYLRHNADGLLRGDLQSRSEAMSKQIQTGLMTPNEGRSLEDRPPLPGGDQLFIPTNHIPITAAGKLAKEDEDEPPTDS